MCSFKVGDLPPEMKDAGVFLYGFKPVHRPYRHLYPHSEVQAFKDGVHVNEARMSEVSPDFHLRFRERLLRVTRIALGLATGFGIDPAPGILPSVL